MHDDKLMAGPSSFSFLETVMPSNPLAALSDDTQSVFSSLFSPDPDASEKTVLPSIPDMRLGLEQLLQKHMTEYPPEFNRQDYVMEKIGGIDCHIWRQSSQPSDVPTLVMFSGGGFCFDNTASHQIFMAHVLANMNGQCHIIVPICPLAPENKAPAVVDRMNQFMQELGSNTALLGFSDNLKLLGWSSGACLALGAALDLQQNRPAVFNNISQLILLSPWLDLSLEAIRHGPYQLQQKLDMAAGADVLEVLRNAYLDNEKIDNPLFSPLHQAHPQLALLPQTTIIAGECEALIADAVLATYQLSDANAPVTLLIKKGLTHNYMVFKNLGVEAVSKMTAAVIQAPESLDLPDCTIIKPNSQTE